FRGKESHEFYTDPQVIADFKDVITYVMNRTNTYTGIPYKEDKAILAWETGNELDSPDAWIAEIVEHIKSQHPSQLILDGNYGVSEASLSHPDIDIV
ncbi:beta-1,4 mannanase, partial [Escherichia coli]